MRTTLYALENRKFEERYLHLPRCMSIFQWNEILLRGTQISELAEKINELSPADAVFEADQVFLSGSAAWVILGLCIADCAVSTYEVGASDFFFADLSANPPAADGLENEVREAWEAFWKVADVSALYRKHLPWWTDEAARSRSSFAGLLTLAEARLIGKYQSQLFQLLTESPAASDPEDTERLLGLITDAGSRGCRVLGWETGT